MGEAQHNTEKGTSSIITLLKGSTGVVRKKMGNAAARSLKSIIIEEENGLCLLRGSTGVLRKGPFS